MSMKKIFILLFSSAILLMGCGEEHQAQRLVKGFLDNNLKNNDISEVEYSNIDSTFFITDSMIRVMRNSTSNDVEFKKKMSYSPGKINRKKMFLSVRFNTIKGDKKKYTFYLNDSCTEIICLKKN
jgi:PBP1b-binding outer membrane lipoprotein LpoB